MLNENFENRKQYIQRNNELNKQFDKNVYQKGANRKIELEQKLEAMSINNDILFSGQLARKNVLGDAAKTSNNISYVSDIGIQDSNEFSCKNKKEQTSSNSTIVNSDINRGKEIADKLKKTDKRSNIGKFSI